MCSSPGRRPPTFSNAAAAARPSTTLSSKVRLCSAEVISPLGNLEDQEQSLESLTYLVSDHSCHLRSEMLREAPACWSVAETDGMLSAFYCMPGKLNRETGRVLWKNFAGVPYSSSLNLKMNTHSSFIFSLCLILHLNKHQWGRKLQLFF